MIDAHLPLIDLRAEDAYQSGHYLEATHLPWPDLQTRLNELPERPASLQLLGDDLTLATASAFLIDKGYSISNQMTLYAFEQYCQKHPGLVVLGSDSRALWQPTPLLLEFIKHLENNDLPSMVLSNRRLALDIGCGGGRDSVYLALRGWQVIAIDREQRVLQRAEQLAQSTGQTVPIDWRACAVEADGCLPEQQLDLIVMMRFLNRSVVAQMAQMLKPGGYVVIQTFVEGVEQMGSPKNPNYILKKGELAKTFGAFDVIVDRIDALKDGRPVASFIAQKRETDDVRNERG
ncbi:methyltransferase type 11 [Hydrogenovibrio sp. SC-1]|uniref:methyltransferase domain-containing protein n=1 Tax=Hydrogenovibrio sp. SC-1 TaxID=2065820 RepID=UPI000C7BDE53|nr:methyltransferase domain-containing protein [Hydrogenovibrio sp. SC-1]PLA74363.1 methyltransferase type 11 [Hydrogenovibrio sp. SC-1]